MNGVELGFRALLAEMAGEGKPVPPGETDAVLNRLAAAKRVFEAKASVATRPAALNSGDETSSMHRSGKCATCEAMRLLLFRRAPSLH